MKKIRNILIIIFSTALLASCHLYSDTAVEKKSGKVYFSFGERSSSRTAMPVVDWTKYTYTIKGICGYGTNEAKPETILLEKASYESLSNGLPVELENYLFKVVAYTGNTLAFSGAKEADLSAGHANITFTMYPLTGATGNAIIKFILPDDGVIKRIKAGYVSESDYEAQNFKRNFNQELTINSDRTASIDFKGLSSNAINCGYFEMYDEKGSVIYSLFESMIIFGGAVSYSTIKIEPSDYHRTGVAVTIKKDGVVWTDCTKTVSLVNEGTSYALKAGNGVYAGSVPETIESFKIYIDGIDSGFTLSPNGASPEVNYFTVTIESGSKGVEVQNVESNGTACEKLEENKYAVLTGSEINFNVSIKEGYEKENFNVLQNATVIANDTGAIQSSPVTSSTLISVQGLKLKSYTITYTPLPGGNDPSGHNRTYNVEDEVNLLSSAEFKPSANTILAGWKISGTDTIIGKILPGTYHEDLVLTPVTKDVATADDTAKIIYANGISLLICYENGETHVYHDFNSNGVKEDDDTQVVGNNGNKNFTGYSLEATHINGEEIYSDFRFTMTGGTIASIRGLGADAPNKSELFISGNAKIGTASDDLSSVTGVVLESITNEWVTIDGQMTGDYHVNLITRYDYSGATHHYVAYIQDSNYAELNNFKCYKKIPGLSLYEKKLIAMKNIKENDVDKIIIRLANPNPIALPDPSDSDDKINGTVDEGFSVGEDRIAAECSVFSVSVDNGYFIVGNETLPGGTEYLAQPSETTYVTSLSKDTKYVYMHILSSTNEISASDASAFLANLTFVRNDKSLPITLSINLETVPFTDIQTANVSYFNGSFYKGVKKGGSIKWNAAYNEAKESTFNGLHGYLINITSLVENNYIFKRMGIGKCWTGGARFSEKNISGFKFDSSNFNWQISAKTNMGTFYWQSGPEAGTWYQDGTIRKNMEGMGLYSAGAVNGFVNWDSGEPNDSARVGSIFNATYYSEQCMHYKDNGKWNDFRYDNTDVTGYIVEYTPYSNNYNSETANFQSIKMKQSYDENDNNVIE